MLKSEPFEATLANQNSFILPELISELFKKHNQKRVRTVIYVNGKHLEYHAAIISRKNGLDWMFFSKEKQKALNIFINDYFIVQLFEDKSKYGVEMPEELHAVLLSDFEASSIFENLTDGKKRSIIYTVKRYKNVQTRVDKALLLTENLKRGITNPKLWLQSF